MGQYYTDFSETIASVDHQISLDCFEPSSGGVMETAYSRLFFRPWTATDNDWTVVTFDSQTAIKHRSSASARRALVWASGGAFVDVEVLGRLYVDTTQYSSAGLVVRASGTAGAENAYRFAIYPSTPGICIGKYASGVSSLLKSTAVSFTSGWYWIRAQAIGGDLKMRIWADGEPEPGTWNLEHTDSSPLTSPGYCGFINFELGKDSYFTNLRVIGTPVYPLTWGWGWGVQSQAIPQVVTDAACEGGKALLLDQYGAAMRRFFLWDTVPPTADIKVQGCFKASAIVDGLSLFRVRAFGHEGQETGYTLERPASDALQIRSYVYGSYADFGSQSYTLAADTWYRVRFEAVGVNFKAKIWPKGEAEPGTWLIDVDDTTDAWNLYPHAYKGWFGIGCRSGSTDITWDWIGVGTDGDEAPTP